MSEAPSRSAARRGRTLKLYLVDGTPSGVITAELGVSSVRAAVASRTALPELIRREEATRTGVYLLVGPDPDLPGRQLVYVGEGDQVRTRLAEGVLVPGDDDRFLRFTADTPFDTPSGAARVVYGGNVSGPRYWKHATTGQTYGEWRKQRIGAEGAA
jgi:hypothetical protein